MGFAGLLKGASKDEAFTTWSKQCYNFRTKEPCFCFSWLLRNKLHTTTSLQSFLVTSLARGSLRAPHCQHYYASSTGAFEGRNKTILRHIELPSSFAYDAEKETLLVVDGKIDSTEMICELLRFSGWPEDNFVKATCIY